ncbi:MAG: 1-deoxy-D-xylulose-5-phosphate synthase [Candidatus Marinimicrobia bacterium]|nr:1-deoxy-D-xylulose-5-phosphate synthase [Candidatus Neomarinimicrobiota bacterium]MCH7858555.1 1-deoxy-D-xylulose-5-phosphate synthase [Candidatus Neomarinimicrobiota bacterium]
MNQPYPLLANIDGPDDLKKLPQEKLPQLASEVAELIKTVVRESGGHYSSPLGVVDLTIALHYVFDSPRDQLVWDVGHQAYAHKILTGRRDSFKTLRTKNGISGFLRRSESEHDVFGAGHASTSISAGLGMAEAHHLKGEDGHVVAIIGDGALTGGLAYEGLNNLGFKELRMTVVLNDNRMSISPSVGSLSKYLTRIVTNPLYNRIRDDVWKAAGLLPLGTKAVRTFLHRLEEGLKAFISPGVLFEELGLRYFGPIDGHDYDSMLKVFKSVRALPYPTLVHVLTQKGHGVEEAENDSQRYYSLPGRKEGKPGGKLAPDFSKVFGQTVVALAKEDDRICGITAAMEVGTGFGPFARAYPQRYYDVGIAEEHAVTFAGGLATQGLRPIVVLYSTFAQRSFDQIMHDIALQNLPVVFCLDRAGLVGPDGPTHHGLFDMVLLRSIPNMVVCAPKDGDELRDLLFSAVQYNGPVAIRYPKSSSINFDPDGIATFIPQGKWEIIRDGIDVILLAVGSMVPVAQQAAARLAKQHGVDATVINARFIKPVDGTLLEQLALGKAPIITVEEGMLAGGFGSAIREYLSAKGYSVPVVSLGIKDNFIEHATRDELLELVQLTPVKVAERALEIIPLMAVSG